MNDSSIRFRSCCQGIEMFLTCWIEIKGEEVAGMFLIGMEYDMGNELHGMILSEVDYRGKAKEKPAA